MSEIIEWPERPYAFTIPMDASKIVIHDQARVWGVFCLRQSTFVDGKQISVVYLPGPWFAGTGT